MITGRLENGLRYAVRQSGSSVAYCAMSISCGTRAEAESLTGSHYHEGLAHFVEHTIFKGTAHRSAANINSCLDKLGGELNAYTTKEEIVIHATVLKDDLPKAAGLLFELAVCPTFPGQEVELEKGVVIDEIASCKDSPAEEIYDRFEELFFAGHPLGRSILGNVRSVKGMSTDELKRWTEEFFVPERMVFTIVSPMPEVAMEKIVKRMSDKWLGGLKRARAEQLPDGEVKSAHVSIFDRTVSRKGHQVNCIIAASAPSLYSGKDRIAAILLGNILGGPAGNSVLNAVLRERNGLVYNVECSYTQYSDGGIMAICFGCDKENLEKCVRIIRREIKRLQDVPLTAAKLKAAKRQLLGQMAVSSESGEAQCLTMGKSMLAYGRVLDEESTRKAIEEVSSDDLRTAAEVIFAEGSISTLTYL